MTIKSEQEVESKMKAMIATSHDRALYSSHLRPQSHSSFNIKLSVV